MKPLKLPSYALGGESALLVQITCRGRCKTMRRAKMDGRYPGRRELKDGQGPTSATCLKCGFEANDYYNWGRTDLDY